MTTRFEDRLLAALAEIDARRPVAAPAAQVARRRRWIRRPAVLAGAAAAVVLAGGAATAGMLMGPKEVLQTTTGLAPGETTGIKGWGCEPGSTVTIRLDGTRLGTARAEKTSPEPVVGWFTSRVTIPEGTAPGAHTLTSTCPAAEGGGAKVLTQEITVRAP